ncbi:MAG: tetratricopeptide repeat protein [Devosia sp.]
MGQTATTFGRFVLTEEGLTRDGTPIAVGQRGLALLIAMARADGPVSKSDLMDAGWPGVTVEESNLTVQIAALRKSLGQRDDGQEWIVTVPRVGYRLLRTIAAAPDAGIPTLAVLPFQNLSDDPEQQYFADGVVDELITALSRFRSFAVVARSSSFSMKGRPDAAKELAEALGVRYLVEGSVRRAGDRLRLVAQLVDSRNGANLWAQTFEGTVDEIFTFQDSITGNVAAMVEPLIQRAEIERSRRERPESMAAYDLYLRAVANLYKFDPEANAEAINLLERAMAIDPGNAVFLSFAAWGLEHRASIGWTPLGPDDRDRAVEYANAALEVGGNDATVLAHCGLTLQLVGQQNERGLLIAMRAVEINPNDTVALLTAGVAHMIGGDLEEARVLLRKVLDIDAGNPEALGTLAHVYFYQGHMEEAINSATRALATSASFIPSYWALIAANAELGRLDEAHSWVEALLKRVPGTTMRWATNSPKPQDPKRSEMLFAALRKAGIPEV